MTSKFDWSQFKENTPIKESGSFDWAQFKKEPEERSTLAKAGRLGAQYGIGAAEGATMPYNIAAFGAKKLADATAPQEFRQNIFAEIERLQEEKARGEWDENSQKQYDSYVDLIKNPEKMDQFLPKDTPDFDVGSLLEKGLGALGVDGRPEGAGEHVARFAGLFNPKNVYQSGKKFIQEAAKPAEEVIVKQAATKVTEKFPSGITKPRAVDAKYAEKAIITPEKQAKTIKALEQEAADLTRKSVEKHVPITKDIKAGVDFDKKFQTEFGELNKLAERHNLEIDISPLNKFLRETRDKFKGIPNLHPEAKKIMSEIKGFMKKPVTDLNNIVKTIRSNNKKLGNIYETKFLKGHQKEFADFLKGTNKALEESFTKYLPSDSQWVKQYHRLNKEYSAVQKGKETLQKLEPLLGERLDTKTFRKLGFDQKKQQKLALSMGKEGSQEVIQISKDLNKAVESIKRMSAKELSQYEAALPIGVLIPGIGKAIGVGAAIYKGSKYARRAYGLYLSNPATRKVYAEALEAISNHDISAFKKATAILAGVIAHELIEETK